MVTQKPSNFKYKSHTRIVYLEKVRILGTIKRHQNANSSAHCRINDTLIATWNECCLLNRRHHIANEKIGNSLGLLWSAIQITTRPEGLCARGIILKVKSKWHAFLLEHLECRKFQAGMGTNEIKSSCKDQKFANFWTNDLLNFRFSGKNELSN